MKALHPLSTKVHICMVLGKGDCNRKSNMASLKTSHKDQGSDLLWWLCGFLLVLFLSIDLFIPYPIKISLHEAECVGEEMGVRKGWMERVVTSPSVSVI